MKIASIEWRTISTGAQWQTRTHCSEFQLKTWNHAMPSLNYIEIGLKSKVFALSHNVYIISPCTMYCVYELCQNLLHLSVKCTMYIQAHYYLIHMNIEYIFISIVYVILWKICLMKIE